MVSFGMKSVQRQCVMPPAEHNGPAKALSLARVLPAAELLARLRSELETALSSPRG